MTVTVTGPDMAMQLAEQYVLVMDHLVRYNSRSYYPALMYLSMMP